VGRNALRRLSIEHNDWAVFSRSSPRFGYGGGVSEQVPRIGELFIAQARRCRRGLLATAAAVVVLALPQQALGELSLPGWRLFTPAARIEVDSSSSAESRPPVRLISHRFGKAAIDQILRPAPATFSIRVRGDLISGQGTLFVEWTDDSGEVLEERQSDLELEGGIAEHRFESPPGAAQARVAVVQDEGDSTLELDSIELLEAGEQSFVNEELLLEGCEDDNAAPEPPYGPRTVPGWETAGDEMWLEVERSQESAPLRLFTQAGAGRLVQNVSAPNKPITIIIEGAVSAEGGVLAIEWLGTERQGILEEKGYPLTLEEGVETLRVRPPRESRRLAIALIGLQPGSLVVDRVVARSDGRQLLANPTLDVPACPPAPVAAQTLGPLLRWSVTGALLGLVALMLFLAARRTPDPFEPTVSPPPPGRKTRRALLAAVALVPFVSIGTAKFGIRIIPADWIFLGLALVLLGSRSLRSAALADRARAVALMSAILLAVVSGVSLVLALSFWTDSNLAELSSGDRFVADLGSPALRGLVEELHLVQGVAAVFVLAALVHTRQTWLSVARTIAITGAVVAAYGMYQVGAEALLDSVPQPPWAYRTEGFRAGGTFPEPTAFGGFLVFAAACGAAVLELRWSKAMAGALLVIFGGLLASRSTVGILGLGLLIVALLSLRRLRAGTVLALPAIAVAALTIAFGAPERWREVYAKPFQVSTSLVEREAAWGGALRMGAAYAPTGAGRGQFAYDQAPFVAESAEKGGRVNSFFLELWAESGPVGLFLGMMAILAGPLWLLQRRGRAHGPPSAERLVVVAVAVSLVGVLAFYYTTSFVWTWVAIGLLAAAPRALLRAQAEPALAPGAQLRLPGIDAPPVDSPAIVADEVEIYLSDRAATPDLVRFLSDREVGVASESGEPGRVTVRLGHPRAIVELSAALSSWLEADGCELRMSTRLSGRGHPRVRSAP
jgi:O-Antigen ligase